MRRDRWVPSWWTTPLIAGLVGIASPGLAQDEPEEPTNVEKPRLLVLDLETTGNLPEDIATAMGQVLVSELQTIGRHDVLSSKDLVALLQLEQQKQMVGCNDDACLIEIAGALDATWLIAGGLSVLGQQARLNLKLMDAKEAKITKQLNRPLPSDEDDYAWEAKTAAYLLLDLPPPEREIPLYKNPWLWVGVGAAVIGGSVAGYFLLRPTPVPNTGLGQVVVDAR